MFGSLWRSIYQRFEPLKILFTLIMNGYYIIDGISGHYNLDSLEYSEIEESIRNGAFMDAFDEIIDVIPAMKESKCVDFDTSVLEEVYDIIPQKYGNAKVIVFDANDRLIASYDLKDIYLKLIEGQIYDENGDIYTCEVWSTQLDNFIKKSSWQIALMSDKGTIVSSMEQWPMPLSVDKEIRWIQDGELYHPVMWFGDKNSPVFEWTIQDGGLPALVSNKDGMGDYGGQMRYKGFEINYMKLFDCWGSWYFGACGNPGADFSKVVDTCPIDVLSLYGKKEGLKEVAKYCLELKTRSR